ncbi:MAG: zinc-dependent alcohol dehydrogenase family protein [Sphingomonadales bacterium]|nr:zinc-dependent alcohol dehydrogenase family protein [Sphingomonadales bacterium]
MRATIMHKAGDVRIENVPDATIRHPTDAVIRVTRACICGSDLWPYNDLPDTPGGRPMGHEAIGVVEAIGSAVQRIKVGQVVIMPFAFSDGTCLFCEDGLHTSCVHGGFFGSPDVGGAQAEALRIPQADGTLFPIDIDPDDALMPALLTLSDVMGTGHHAAISARVGRGHTVAVIGDGAVGLCGVIAARRLGAEQIILLGRHEGRTTLGRNFGATDVVGERGGDAIARVRELTGGYGVQSVLECVGNAGAIEMAMGIVRPGGAVGRVGVPHYDAVPGMPQSFYDNVIVAGGPAPVRGYIADLLPDVLEGRIEPGRVFDRTVDLDGVPAGYKAMNDRTALKVLVRP